MKKLISLVVIIVLLFASFIVFYLKPKSYEMTYVIDEYNVIEKYFKNEKYYYFEIKGTEYSYDFISEIKYRSNRKIIESIDELNEDGMNCILPKLKKASTYPLCYDNNKLVSFHLIDNRQMDELYPVTVNNVENTYKNINIFSYVNQTFLLWNYRGFYFINEDTKKEILLFKKDVYNLSLATMVNNYLFIPDYDSEYSFKRAYIIDMKTGKYEEWNLDNEISFSSYIMGSFDKSLYLFDQKSKIQYELVPHKKKMRKINKESKYGKIYLNGWEDISVKKLESGENKFEFLNLYKYNIEDKELYLSNMGSEKSTKITNLENVKIVYQNGASIYYLKDDKLYLFNPFDGEILLMQFFEWNFNYTNMIFVY